MDITGIRVKALRTTYHMSQEELAKQLGYTGRASISALERGAMNITLDKLVEISKIFGVPISYLLGMDNTDDNFDSECIVALFNNLNDEGKKIAKEYLEMLSKNEKYKK